MADAKSSTDESAETTAPAAPRDDWRAPFEGVLLLAALAASGCAAAVIVGGLKGWTSPTLGVIFLVGLVECAVAIGLAVKVLLVADKRLGLFVPGVTLAALATASLLGVFLLSGSV